MATVLGLDGCAVECVHPDKVRLVTENAPRPEEIGRTGSHGCFRLANWNAEKLIRLIRIGMPVTVEE